MLKSGVKVKGLPSKHILRQFVRKTKSNGELTNGYDEMCTVDTWNSELVY